MGKMQIMVHPVLERDEVGGLSSISKAYIEAYRIMLLARILDEKFASLYRMGKIHGGVFLGRGQEALSVSVGLALRKGDIFAPLIRDTAGGFGFLGALLASVRTHFRLPLGPTRGRGGKVERRRPPGGLV